MWIAMTVQVSGGRADGTEWPPAYTPFEAPDGEALDLLRGKLAYRVNAPAQPAREQEPEHQAGVPDAVVTAPETVPAAAQDSAGVPDEAGQLAADPGAPPKPADAKQAWVDYAMAHGATEDEANMMTKADLMSKYGGRL